MNLDNIARIYKSGCLNLTEVCTVIKDVLNKKKTFVKMEKLRFLKNALQKQQNLFKIDLIKSFIIAFVSPFFTQRPSDRHFLWLLVFYATCPHNTSSEKCSSVFKNHRNHVHVIQRRVYLLLSTSSRLETFFSKRLRS